MSADAVVRELFAAFSARDPEAAVAVCHEDASFWPQGTAEQVGRSAPYEGHDGIRRYFADLARAWRTLEVEPGSTRVAGAGVIVFGRARGTTRDGRTIDQPVIWVFKVTEGRICSLRAVATAAEAQRVARA